MIGSVAHAGRRYAAVPVSPTRVSLLLKAHTADPGQRYSLLRLCKQSSCSQTIDVARGTATHRKEAAAM